MKHYITFSTKTRGPSLLFFPLFPFFLLFPFINYASTSTPKAPLTMSRVMANIIERSPRLASGKWEIQTREAVKHQESLRPNPEIGLEMENFAGSGEVRGFKGAEYSFSISQPVILGGKRNKRIDAAKLDVVLARREYDVMAADLIKEAKSRFIDALLLQERLELRKHMLKLSEQFLENIRIRVKAGKTPAAEQLQAEVDVFRTRMILTRMEQNLTAAKLNLAGLWGDTAVTFSHLEGDLKTNPDVPGMPEWEKRLAANTDLLLSSSVSRHKQAQWLLERANRLPDPVIGGGIRRLNEAGGSAFFVSVSVPIPLFNRNQGAIEAARFRLEKAQAQHKTAKRETLNRVRVLVVKLKAARSTIQVLQDSILPKAAEAADSIIKGYRSGRFNYLDVMDAFRTQLEVKEEYLETMAQLRQLIIELERLTSGVNQ